MGAIFKKESLFLVIIFLIFSVSTAYSFQEIRVKPLASAPVLDGSNSDWSHQTLDRVPLTKTKPEDRSDVEAVYLSAGVFGDEFFLFAVWSDASENKLHKPFVWNPSEERYIRGPQREDRFSIQFAMEGDYTTQWFSGREFKADMWHWKSSRTNPVNLAHDKMTIITSTPMKKSYKTTAANGRIIYLYRPSDAGDPIYYSKRYSIKEKDVMPKYFFTENPKGSITDVKARGVWQAGKWMLELKRKLNTGNSDDISFENRTSVKAGIGIFNASATDDHNISDTIVFVF